jgi:hypothetical protein
MEKRDRGKTDKISYKLEVIIAVDNKGKAYISEIKMLNQILNKVDFRDFFLLLFCL